MTLLFCDTDPGYIQAMKVFLIVLKLIRVNLGKSEMVPVGDVRNIKRLASILGCMGASLPMTYLGLLLGEN